MFVGTMVSVLHWWRPFS